MRAFLVVEVGLIAYQAASVEAVDDLSLIDRLLFQRSPESPYEDVVQEAPLAIHRDVLARSRNRSVQSKDVNCDPWTPF